MNLKIAVIGLGYVGLPLANALSKNFSVFGFDHNIKRINELKLGIDTNNEIKVKSKKIHFSDKLEDIKNCNIYILTVPTPVDKKKIPDLRIIKKALKNIATILKKKDIVVLESTVYPGFTNEIAAPTLERFSKLKFNKDFFCGYSPERINPGDKKNKLENIIKIVAGSNIPTTRIIKKVYGTIIKAGIHEAESIEIAEAAKVIENTQRDLNIALINEFKIIFDKMGLSTSKILKAASTKWNFLNFLPGLVGGHCIGVDPYYLTYKANKIGVKPKVILAGRKLNNSMGNYFANKFFNFLKRQKIFKRKKKILILGLAFKENCNDIRNSKVFDIIKNLSKNFYINVYDPHVNKKDVNFSKGIRLITKIKKYQYDGIIIAVKHDAFKTLGFKKIISFGNKNSLIYDIKNIFIDSKNPILKNDII